MISKASGVREYNPPSPFQAPGGLGGIRRLGRGRKGAISTLVARSRYGRGMNFMRVRMRFLGLVCLASVYSWTAQASARTSGVGLSTSACGRQCLIGFADRYLDSLVQHDPSGLPLVAKYKFTENGQRLKLGEGLWYGASDIAYRQYIADPARGAVVSYVALHENDLPTLLVVRLKVVNRKISEIETVVVGFDDSLDARVATLNATKPLMGSILPEAERSSRTKLESVATLYFDAMQTHPPSGPSVPFAPDCDRTEDGIHVTNSQGASRDRPAGCAAEFASQFLYPFGAVRDRRFYISDVERGQVFAIVMLDCPGRLKSVVYGGKTIELSPTMRRPRTVIVPVLFKVVQGQIREIEGFPLHGVFCNLPYKTPSGW